MGFFRAAFVRVFFGASNTLTAIARRARRTANATAFVVKNALMQAPSSAGALARIVRRMQARAPALPITACRHRRQAAKTNVGWVERSDTHRMAAYHGHC